MRKKEQEVQNYLKSIIKEISEEEKIQMQVLSKEWIIKLTKGEKIAYIVGSKFSINSDSTSRIASDKYATYEVLKNAGIPIIEHQMVFNPQTRKNVKSDLKGKREIIQYFQEHHNMVVVKANDGFRWKYGLFV